jgi:peptidoglycan/xylan/chitin deacetylase (PgdA/CDA1 family)
MLFSFIITLLLSVALRANAEIYMMCEREGEIAFTYDQGPSQYTGKLLVTLAKHKVKATFHISPDYLDNPVILAYLRKATMDGHLIGIFVKEEVEADSIKEYLAKASAAIQRYTNYKPQFLRFPAPGPSEEVMKTVSALGYIVTTYNLDSQDYNAVNVPVEGNESVFSVYKDIFDQILPPAKGSFIAIQRDIVQASVEQSDQIIQYALDKGYKPVRLDQCIRKPQAGSSDKNDSNSAAGGGDSKKKLPAPEADNKIHKFESENENGSTLHSYSISLGLFAMASMMCLFF